MTTEQIAANRKSAGNLIRYRLGLDTVPTNEWSYDQRTAFNKALAAYIASHPSAFAPSDILTAQTVAQNEYTPLQNSSFSVADFVATTAANAAAPVQAIGDGIISTAKAARWAIPLIAAVAVVLVIITANKKLASV